MKKIMTFIVLSMSSYSFASQALPLCDAYKNINDGQSNDIIIEYSKYGTGLTTFSYKVNKAEEETGQALKMYRVMEKDYLSNSQETWFIKAFSESKLKSQCG